MGSASALFLKSATEILFINKGRSPLKEYQPRSRTGRMGWLTEPTRGSNGPDRDLGEGKRETVIGYDYSIARSKPIQVHTRIGSPQGAQRQAIHQSDH